MLNFFLILAQSGDANSMESLIVNLVGSAPAAAAVIIVVLVFLRFLRTGEKERQETLKHINDDNRDFQNRTITSIDKNTEMLGKTSALLERVSQKLSDFPKQH